jgi:hypothetical protein
MCSLVDSCQRLFGPTPPKRGLPALQHADAAARQPCLLKWRYLPWHGHNKPILVASCIFIFTTALTFATQPLARPGERARGSTAKPRSCSTFHMQPREERRFARRVGFLVQRPILLATRIYSYPMATDAPASFSLHAPSVAHYWLLPNPDVSLDYLHYFLFCPSSMLNSSVRTPPVSLTRSAAGWLG